jgi:hypothetical protein
MLISSVAYSAAQMTMYIPVTNDGNISDNRKTTIAVISNLLA